MGIFKKKNDEVENDRKLLREKIKQTKEFLTSLKGNTNKTSDGNMNRILRLSKFVNEEMNFIIEFESKHPYGNNDEIDQLFEIYKSYIDDLSLKVESELDSLDSSLQNQIAELQKDIVQTGSVIDSKINHFNDSVDDAFNQLFTGDSSLSSTSDLDMAIEQYKREMEEEKRLNDIIGTNRKTK